MGVNMQETVEQYTQRLSGYVKGKNHLKVLESTPKKIAKLFRGSTVRKLANRPEEGKWSAAEIIAHLAESEIVFGYRLRLVLGANGTAIQAFDQDVWQSNAEYLKRKPRLGLDLFCVLRGANVALLKSLPKERWEDFGMHSERGKETVLRMAELYAGHDVNHVMQIERIAKTREKKGRK